MALMANRRMATVGTMLVSVVGMVLLSTGGHRIFSFLVLGPGKSGDYCLSAACSMALSTKRKT